MFNTGSLNWLTLNGYARYVENHRLISMIKEHPAGIKDFSDVAIYCGSNYRPDDVLFLQESVGQGCEIIINFRTTYNSEFKDYIKATCSAKFLKRTSSWDVVINDETESLDAISNSINELYPIVVFLNEGTILKKEVDNNTVKPRWSIPAITPVYVSAFELITAYDSLRKNEDIKNIAIFNSETFVKLGDGVNAQVDLLLLRFDMAQVQPRYAFYAVSKKSLSIVSFGNSGKTSGVISGYANTTTNSIFTT